MVIINTALRISGNICGLQLVSLKPQPPKGSIKNEPNIIIGDAINISRNFRGVAQKMIGSRNKMIISLFFLKNLRDWEFGINSF